MHVYPFCDEYLKYPLLGNINGKTSNTTSDERCSEIYEYVETDAESIPCEIVGEARHFDRCRPISAVGWWLVANTDGM